MKINIEELFIENIDGDYECQNCDMVIHDKNKEKILESKGEK